MSDLLCGTSTSLCGCSLGLPMSHQTKARHHTYLTSASTHRCYPLRTFYARTFIGWFNSSRLSKIFTLIPNFCTQILTAQRELMANSEPHPCSMPKIIIGYSGYCKKCYGMTPFSFLIRTQIIHISMHRAAGAGFQQSGWEGCINIPLILHLIWSHQIPCLD